MVQGFVGFFSWWAFVGDADQAGSLIPGLPWCKSQTRVLNEHQFGFGPAGTNHHVCVADRSLLSVD
jgi:hypothetical protein